MIEVRSLYYSYNSKPVIQDLEFEAERGEFVFILGPNGSGKTTLLKCMAGILKPKGAVLVEKVSIDRLSGRDLARKLAYVPQRSDSGFLTVYDVVLLGRRPYMGFSPSDEDYRIVEDVLSLLDLKKFSYRRINELSGGELQKVMIARALAQKPKILLLDEPTNNLDVKNQIEIMKLLRKIADEKEISVISTMHDLNLAAIFADKIVMLKNGRIFASGGKEVLTQENIKEVYGIEVEVLRHNGRVLIVPQ
ncbi:MULTISPECIES: ABC transporter ATP-binding protein [Archaeoglobus]|jgi:iron complex transport system ATP-binding protein|uniref:Iron (III) ABC transporter, ATP-binding protein (HemV-1) n=3 Tax=Archaeoglobus fulgidus TaxID=2234 RepID=O29819_ARCFU|nr:MULTISPECIES: ABC transporter ATP-binding protein [Archaeoglobus]AAB90807.1 iron (III) ABC transporter, ATP-binding protein (hemV-1) [Archaeoglobus fulgidus DSM 4304]AIG97248.1 ABC-type cobalamin/Fe3+-siderophores transport system, ATPase component [Archaeoglobus fulgidus DSM 8774]KUJ92412.1 MAG: Iron (III) ABC transporter, ATP-binding protein (HemV-1) [Archaeoglobus fulgidus]KUK05354.1 MAG: Iron (III) ABC transporter, ATP-binding protein (HemV-1) [Archaeoglobus fulgidus]MDI3497247.1 iron c